ncbi:MAG: peptidoglycan-binding protein [Flavobacteriia bacterium]|nr:peptidoglycan-binding protein [Flavobacteriia bacterium]OIP45103.1 MAG: hypothetical protein AUK46_13345 [Flavobacteriaceae bacterium CG2_30_31_66]PIV95299.1 MAG: peptidoglycan-binding protein [Flavobacteriaceae bacterium CG17_big_fil_post_rev_8_21_14_2_50_31_13]PIX14807.1 MAG: peptidoglycan-binding protein [Flavobacteriaceae bacterium CG_4_8_14_3_um_filter_31_8]PIY13630.1 MAG: peptidoglycan-binding protein [Flavobacteriaceae bacterium CG_4_10_14_3_um_filter_31_253]PIZ11809.1 MAG: peptidogl
MKQIIIFLLLVIVILIGYGKYSQYKRFNSPEIDYKTTKKIDLQYHNQTLLMSYYEAIETLNSYTKLQWTANSIDVRAPKNDDLETQIAVKEYAKKLANVHYFGAILENSFKLKSQGMSNQDIEILENSGMSVEDLTQKNTFESIKKLFTPNIQLYNGEKNTIIFEVQKRLVALGDEIKIDGVYRIETLNAIKKFEEKNGLMADGYLDSLTLELLFR